VNVTSLQSPNYNGISSVYLDLFTNGNLTEAFFMRAGQTLNITVGDYTAMIYLSQSGYSYKKYYADMEVTSSYAPQASTTTIPAIQSCNSFSTLNIGRGVRCSPFYVNVTSISLPNAKGISSVYLNVSTNGKFTNTISLMPNQTATITVGNYTAIINVTQVAYGTAFSQRYATLELTPSYIAATVASTTTTNTTTYQTTTVSTTTNASAASTTSQQSSNTSAGASSGASDYVIAAVVIAVLVIGGYMLTRKRPQPQKPVS
jgi:hypothetical protein